MHKIKEQKGITLIALVITIVVMLILVGVTISVSLKGGLFSTAKQATNETQIAKEREELLMGTLGALNKNGGVDIGKLDNNLPEGFEGSGGIYTNIKTGNKYKVSEDGTVEVYDGTEIPDEEESEAPHTHSYTQTITTAATCTSTGIKTFSCNCGDTYTETIAALGHTTENGTCENCGKTISNDDWIPMTWSGLTNFSAQRVWGDGKNIYYSSSMSILGMDTIGQFVLNGDTWEEKTWNGLTNFNGNCIWTDGTNYYYSNGGDQYVLNGDTWTEKTWSSPDSILGYGIWTDGTSIYYSYSDAHYVLTGDTWETKKWGRSANFDANDIWTDGTNIYCSNSYGDDILKDGDFVDYTWNIDIESGSNIWTDGTNIYYSYASSHYVLDKATSTWEKKTWSGLTSFYGSDIWTDGINTYYSKNTSQYVLLK